MNNDIIKSTTDNNKAAMPQPQKSGVCTVNVLKCSNKTISEHEETIIREVPVTIYFNDKEIVTLLTAGAHLDELAIGFCYAEGYLKSSSDIIEFSVDDDNGKVYISSKTDATLTDRLAGKRTVTSGCGKGTVFYDVLDSLMAKPVTCSYSIEPEAVCNRMNDLLELSQTYRQTHGVHNTALANPQELILFRDDIGRHNAVDMIVGHAFLNDIPLQDKMLITTGRLTSEMVIKAAKIGIPVVVSRNTATSLAVEIAQSLSLTLIGFVRAGKCIVYSGHEKIQSNQ